MFKSAPSGLRWVTTKPTRLGGFDNWVCTRDISASPWELFYIAAGCRIHLPGVTLSGGKLYMGSQEVILNAAHEYDLFNGFIGYGVAGDLAAYGGAITYTTDGDGTYIIINTPITIDNVSFGSPWVSGYLYTYMTFKRFPYTFPTPYVSSIYDISSI